MPFVWLIFLSIAIIHIVNLVGVPRLYKILTSLDWIIPVVLITGLILLFTIT